MYVRKVFNTHSHEEKGEGNKGEWHEEKGMVFHRSLFSSIQKPCALSYLIFGLAVVYDTHCRGFFHKSYLLIKPMMNASVVEVRTLPAMGKSRSVQIAENDFERESESLLYDNNEYPTLCENSCPRKRAKASKSFTLTMLFLHKHTLLCI